MDPEELRRMIDHVQKEVSDLTQEIQSTSTVTAQSLQAEVDKEAAVTSPKVANVAACMAGQSIAQNANHGAIEDPIQPSPLPAVPPTLTQVANPLNSPNGEVYSIHSYDFSPASD